MTLPVFSPPPATVLKERDPTWQTLQHRSISGKPSNVQEWSYPIYQYTVDMNALRSAVSFQEYQDFIGFFNSLGGAALPFLYDDVYDDTATDQEFGPGDGTTVSFQLVRAYGGFVEPVFAPDAGFTVTINGTPTSAFSINGSGLVTFGSAPAAAALIKWTGTFKWICSFDSDAAKIGKIVVGYFSVSGITFTTWKV